jgi:hypothetical protein
MKKMNETLDNLFAKCQQLSDEDLGVLLSAMMHEQKDRDCRAHKEAWAKVCEAIADYTANYGGIRVADFCGDENTEIYLYHGQFASSEYGSIEVGA